MKKPTLSRRQLLKASAAGAGAAALSGSLFGNTALAQAADQSAVLVIHMTGGYNAVYGSADSFIAGGTFGVTASNVTNLGNGLVVDSATFGTLPAVARANMAQIGLNHGISSHDPAQVASWSNGSRSYALMLANALGGTAPIRAAVVGGRFPAGPRPAEGTVSMQSITDLRSTINALGGGAVDPTIPDRTIAAAALTATRGMGSGALTANSASLRSVVEGYDTAISALQKPAATFNYATMATAYGVATTTTAVTNFQTQMLAAELMILAGAKVVIAVTPFDWDSHGDTTASGVRTRMTNTILPALRTFLSRMIPATGRNVTTAIVGDFARSLPGSDHARIVSTTVFGKKVKVGTTGRVSATVGLPTGSPAAQQFWSFLAAASQAPTNPFGANPHSALVLP